MAKRRYNVRGIKDFIVLAGIFFFLCLWAVKDAWFPGEKVLKDHPRRVEVAFPIDGNISAFHVAAGDPVIAPREGQNPTLLAVLNDAQVRRTFEEKKARYVEMQEDTPDKRALLTEIDALKTEIEQHELYVPELGKEKGGKVTGLLVSRYDKVRAGQPVLVIEPNKGFYLFNKSLAIFSFIAFWVFLLVHIMTR